LRVRLASSVQYTYPDASVICGEARFDALDPDRRTVINPRVLIEVLSPSTELFDRGEKLRRYLEIESLEEYVMVSQNEPRVETLFRQPEGAWLLMTASGPDGIARLRSLGVDLPLSEIYSGVEFPPQPELPLII